MGYMRWSNLCDSRRCVPTSLFPCGRRASEGVITKCLMGQHAKIDISSASMLALDHGAKSFSQRLI